MHLAFCGSSFVCRLRSASFVRFSFPFVNCRCLLGYEGFLGISFVCHLVSPGPCAAQSSSPQGSPYLLGGLLFLPAVSIFPLGLAAAAQRLTLCLQFLRQCSAPVAHGGAPASLGELPHQEVYSAIFKNSTISLLRVGRNGWSVCSPQPLTSTWMTFCEQIPCGYAPLASRPTPWVSFRARPLILANVCGISRRG